MNCKSCGKVALESMELCRNCFIDSVENRIKKEIRLAPKEEPIIIVTDGTAASKVLEKIVSQIQKESRKELKKVSTLQENAFVPATLDEINSDFLKGVFFRNNSGKNMQKFIFPLAKVTSEECELYCRIKGISFEKKNKDAMQEMLSAMDKRYPGTHFSLKSSRDQLEKIRKG